jgi:hypothetical protein
VHKRMSALGQEQTLVQTSTTNESLLCGGPESAARCF